MPKYKMIAGHLKCISRLDDENLYSRQNEIVDFCINKAHCIPISIPTWLTERKIVLYSDVDEMITSLPQVIQKWYDNDCIPIKIIVPDAVLARECMNTMGKAQAIYKMELIQVKPYGKIMHAGDFKHTLVLCPGRYQSLQIAEIAKKLSRDSYIRLHDPDRIENLSNAIRENDIKHLEFLLARWEIEQQADAKRIRLQELCEQLQAMMGGM